MPAPSLEQVLTATHWAKQAGEHDKASGIGEALKSLTKAHLAVDGKLFDIAKLKASDDVEDRIEEVDAMLKKSVPSACDEAKKVATLARKWEADFKKKPETARTVAPAAGAVAKEAASYAKDLDVAAQSLRTDLHALLKRLQAEEAKKGGGEDAEAEGADEKLVKSKVVSAMRMVKAAKPEAKPVLFLIGVGAKQSMAYMGQSVGTGHRNMIKRLLPTEKALKFHKGTCIWEAKAWTFVGETMPTGGFAKKLQAALKELTGATYKVRVRRPDGPAEEADGETEVMDLAGGEVPPAAPPESGGDSGFNARLQGLQPAIRAAMGGAQADALKDLVGRMGKLAAAKDLAGAGAVLDQIEKLLKQGAATAGVDPVKGFQARMGALTPRIQAVVAAGGKAGTDMRTMVAQAVELGKTRAGVEQATSLLERIEKLLATAAQGGGSVSVVQLSKARGDWADTRATFVTEVKRLLASLDTLYREEPEQGAAVVAAKKQLLNSAGKVTADLENRLGDVVKAADPAQQKASIDAAKKALDAMQKLLAEDPLMKELDGNEVLPDMVIVKPMQQRLQAIAAALG